MVLLIKMLALLLRSRWVIFLAFQRHTHCTAVHWRTWHANLGLMGKWSSQTRSCSPSFSSVPRWPCPWPKVCRRFTCPWFALCACLHAMHDGFSEVHWKNATRDIFDTFASNSSSPKPRSFDCFKKCCPAAVSVPIGQLQKKMYPWHFQSDPTQFILILAPNLPSLTKKITILKILDVLKILKISLLMILMNINFFVDYTLPFKYIIFSWIKIYLSDRHANSPNFLSHH